MCYKCQRCNDVIPPGVPQRRHVIYRLVPNRQSPTGGLRKEIAREIPVCYDCYEELGAGNGPQLVAGHHQSRAVQFANGNMALDRALSNVLERSRQEYQNKQGNARNGRDNQFPGKAKTPQPHKGPKPTVVKNVQPAKQEVPYKPVVKGKPAPMKGKPPTR